MAIFICSNCSHTEETPDEFLGKKARCLKCQTLSTITEKETKTPKALPKTPASNKMNPSPPRDEFSNDERKSINVTHRSREIKSWHVVTLFVLLGAILTAQLVQLEGQKEWEYAIRSPKDSALEEDLNSWGESGWELVFARRATNYAGTAEYEMIFRRRK
ncbi:hypothetical protein [Gimesia aquarii]|uniref:DUF4177 domain-containing protein n=1 Tax=Gimesia aquarii TaxID=2527964 RepID=A0A517WN69_9PLAN|nr:hypothetical protein [Gimesia aquarii]QDU06707.1 hypothetical protein V202x_00500 [Gimesia aquarii]